MNEEAKQEPCHHDTWLLLFWCTSAAHHHESLAESVSRKQAMNTLIAGNVARSKLNLPDQPEVHVLIPLIATAGRNGPR